MARIVDAATRAATRRIIDRAMPQITYVLPDGARRAIDVSIGANVMRTAIEHDVPGIVAECGGAAACATCHVWVEPELLPRLPLMTEVEDEMLESTASERRRESRLSCQLTMKPGLEALVVRIPPEQVA
jgi:2Fe-2S ferredoxin